MRAVTSQYGFTKAFYIEDPGVYKVERPLISFPPPWSFDFIPPPAQRTFDFLPFTRNCMDSIAFLWIFFCISLHFTQFFSFWHQSWCRGSRESYWGPLGVLNGKVGDQNKFWFKMVPYWFKTFYLMLNTVELVSKIIQLWCQMVSLEVKLCSKMVQLGSKMVGFGFLMVVRGPQWWSWGSLWSKWDPKWLIWGPKLSSWGPRWSDWDTEYVGIKDGYIGVQYGKIGVLNVQVGDQNDWVFGHFLIKMVYFGCSIVELVLQIH